MADLYPTELTPDLKREIDDMSQEDMAYHWRFDPTPGRYFGRPEISDYFKRIFLEKGGMTPEISKRLGF